MPFEHIRDVINRLGKLISLYALCFLIPGCQSNESAPKQITASSDPAYRPVVLKSGIENGHPAGIRIAIQTAKESDKTITYNIMSSYQGSPVGFLIVIPREIDGKQKISPSFIKSLGVPSDLFLQLLASQYGQTIDPSANMADSIPFICLNLNNLYGPSETPQEGDWTAAQYKLFFDSDNEAGDAELFMNIVPGKWIEFAEKDEDYRAHLIRIFKRNGK